MNFFDSWLAFNSCFDERDLTALTQLVGYKLLAIDNELQHPESFLLTDRELMNRTGIKSGQTIVAARRQLKNAGLIDFKVKKSHPTRYRFTIKQESSNNQANVKQESSRNQASGIISYTQLAEEEEKKKEDDAGAREADGVKAVEKVSDANAGAKPLTSVTFSANDIQDEWLKVIGYELRGQRALELEQFAAQDFERAKQAIERTGKRHGLKDEFSYFKAVYDGLKPQTLRGGEKDEHPDGGYKLPEYGDDQPWLEY